MYEVTGGDKDPLPHRTMCITTRADSAFRHRDHVTGEWLEGAPCPMNIQTSNTGDKQNKLRKAMWTNILTDGNQTHSESGIKVIAQKSGSMTREAFPIWCRHFVEQLPAGQGGPTGERVFLFLDGHTSRWSYEGLKYLEDNHVIVFCLPSHTSIWSQVHALINHVYFCCELLVSYFALLCVC
jgi:hypothetical protein